MNLNSKLDPFINFYTIKTNAIRGPECLLYGKIFINRPGRSDAAQGQIYCRVSECVGSAKNSP